MNLKKKTASFISLGCFKNLVDTEVLGGLLEKKGVTIVSSYENSDWLLVNTCGFIREAKEESIDEILAALEKKESGEVKHIAVFGCLTQRYLHDLKKTFKDVEIIWGVNELEELAQIIAENETGEYKDKKPFLYNDKHNRIIATTPNSTFIKISEGCNMKCSFCVIPQIKGSYRSREISSIIKEAENYKNMGFQEINLISQNSTYFGKDINKKSTLPLLLKEISRLGLKWIRILYLMPEEIDDEIIESFAHPSIIPYFDIPFQHISDSILKRMNRGGGLAKDIALLQKIRKRYPDAIIRSSFITGFPGESESHFSELVKFIKDTKIERVGIFGYSLEENTEAFKLTKRIPAEVIERRKEDLIILAEENLNNYHKTLLNTTQEFLPLGSWENNTTIGRIISQAPEVDGLTQVNKKFTDDYKVYQIKITDFKNEMIYGERI